MTKLGAKKFIGLITVLSITCLAQKANACDSKKGAHNKCPTRSEKLGEKPLRTPSSKKEQHKNQAGNQDTDEGCGCKTTKTPCECGGCECGK